MSIKEALDQFCQQITGKKPILVPIAPRPWAKEDHCFDNVDEMIARYGGRDRPGWIFGHRPLGTEPGIFVAIHHCIWESARGELLDITPRAENMMRDGDSIVFLPDDAAQLPKPYGAAFGIPRPHRFFTTSKNPGVLELVHCLRRQELADWEKRKEFARIASATLRGREQFPRRSEEAP